MRSGSQSHGSLCISMSLRTTGRGDTTVTVVTGGGFFVPFAGFWFVKRECGGRGAAPEDVK